MVLIKKTKSKYSKVKSFHLNSSFVSRIIFIVLFLFLISLFVNLKLIIFLIISIIVNAYLSRFQLKRGLPTDLELSTFMTILITVSFGSLKWGIFTAIVSKLFASIYNGDVLPDHFFMIATYINAAILASIFSGVNVLTLGLTIVSINCILMFFISKNYLGIPFTYNFSYTGTNFMFNSIVFLIFGELIKAILI